MNQVYILFFLSTLFISNVFAQYAPPAGQPGSTAINKDSSIIQGWASKCYAIRGWQNIADTSLGKVTFGTPYNAIGIADNNVVSLGDSGFAIVAFEGVIYNGEGYDFAVFENAFNDSFLELAFVEVSSDSIHWIRFPSVSLTDTTIQVGTFDTLDATKIHNLAGKYRVLYGTPFDLDDIADSSNINLDSIKYIKIIDVIGDIQTHYSRDSYGHKINDPYTTPFSTGGFDLDAVAALHLHQYSDLPNTTNITKDFINIYPIPAHKTLTIEWQKNLCGTIKIFTSQGYNIYTTALHCSTKKKMAINISNWQTGTYFIYIFNNKNEIIHSKKIIILQ